MPDRKAVYECGRKYLKTPFGKRGRDGRGIDCIGVVLCVGRDLGLNDKDGNPFHPAMYENYPDQPFGDELQEECKKRLIVKLLDTPSSFSQMLPGDIVTMRIPPEQIFRKLFAQAVAKTPITHVGIVSDSNGSLGVIHSLNSRSVNRKVVEHLIDLKWLRRIAGVFSFPGVTD
jgi:hypothetical protein